MIDPTDLDYLDTKLVKQGVKKINFDLEELATWIYKEYNIKVLNIYYDRIDEQGPSLKIIFEYYQDVIKFCDERGNFDSNKQKAIAQKFRQIQSTYINKKHVFFRQFFSKSSTENLFVLFNAFEPIARIEVNNKISKIEIENLENELQSQDVWKIHKSFSMTILFFYTNDQIQQHIADGTAELFKKKYWKLLKKYDEFDYFKPDTNFMTFDSKENFDKTYESNWFYYYQR